MGANYAKLIVSLTRGLNSDIVSSFNSPYLEFGGRLGDGFELDGFKSASLSRVEYEKGMFKPGSVVLHLSVIADGAGSAQQGNKKGLNVLQKELQESFFAKTTFLDLLGVANDVDASTCSDTDLVYIARNYYFQGYDIDTISLDEYSVRLKCYSFDRKLTLSEYCQIYTGKHFSSEIVKTEIPKLIGSEFESYLSEIISDEDPNQRAGSDADSEKSYSNSSDEIYYTSGPLMNVDVKNLLLLGYRKPNDSEKDSVKVPVRTENGNDDELKHPYLVQYNESLYDFISRVAHRCGEFFYFENGKITLGLPAETRKIIFSVSDGSSSPTEEPGLKISPLCSFSHVSTLDNTETSESGHSSFNTDYISPSDVAKISADKKYYHDTVTSDEALHVVTEDDNYYKSLANGDWVLYKALGNLFFRDSFIMGLGYSLGYAAWDLIWMGWLSPLFSIDPDFREKHIESGENTRDVNVLGDNVAVDAIDAEAIANLCNRHFHNVSKWEKTSEENLIKINLESTLRQMYLGNMVRLENVDGTPSCLVVSMKGDYSGNGIFNNAEVIPIEYLSQKTGSLNAVSVPVANAVKHTKKAAPMEAIVTDSVDPLRLSRVRVRYPWQPKDTADKSPWLRVKVPFAGGDDDFRPGFCMTPSKGEHVVLDFFNGNIELPYVSGSMYYHSADGEKKYHVPPIGEDLGESRHYKTTHKFRTIASGKGHALVFEDLNDTDLLSQAIPLAGAITQLVQIDKFKETGEYQSNQVFGTIRGGKVALRDGTGITNINLIPNTREVTINSVLGTINLNAFTGITINAPNGDINIKGKNVNIEAGNNLSITAGKNIDTGESENLISQTLAGLAGMLIGIGVDAALKSVSGVSVENICDLSFLRSLVELALRPVEGTLSIKSRRNVIITAGVGNVTIPSPLMSQASTWTGKKETVAYSDLATSKANDDGINAKSSDYVTVKEYLEAMCLAVDSFYQGYAKLITTMAKSVAAVSDWYVNLPVELQPFLSDSMEKSKYETAMDAYNTLKNNSKEKISFSDVFKDEQLKPENNKDLHYKAWEMLAEYSVRYFLAIDAINSVKKYLGDGTKNVYDVFTSSKKVTDIAKILDKCYYNYKGGIVDSVEESSWGTLHEGVLFGDSVMDRLGSDFNYNTYCTNEAEFDVAFRTRMMMVKKYIVVKTLLKFPQVRIKSADGLKQSSFKQLFKQSNGEFCKEFDDNLKKIVSGKYPWSGFVPLIVKYTPDAKNDKSSVIFRNSLLKGFLGTVGNPVTSFKKLTNMGGAAGPRAFGDHGGNGKILISSDPGHFSVFSDTNHNWELKNNPDPMVIKRFIATIDQPKKYT